MADQEDPSQSVLSARQMKSLKRLRLAVVLIAIGLVLELVALLSFGPGSFVIFVAVGGPCIGLGMLLFLLHVVKDLRKRDAV